MIQSARRCSICPRQLPMGGSEREDRKTVTVQVLLAKKKIRKLESWRRTREEAGFRALFDHGVVDERDAAESSAQCATDAI